MWGPQEHDRFQQLRQRQNVLNETERAELANLAQKLESWEALTLVPATERLRKERAIVEDQNRILENLAHRREALVRRLGDFLVQAQSERRSIERELAAVQSGYRGPETEG